MCSQPSPPRVILIKGDHCSHFERHRGQRKERKNSSFSSPESCPHSPANLLYCLDQDLNGLNKRIGSNSHFPMVF